MAKTLSQFKSGNFLKIINAIEIFNAENNIQNMKNI